ncbi:MAG: sigma-70 family RNA polymerase sigma factor [Planctomycetes bacterium]|jgi:RNA polymerase sigma-70 factor (ECF subfamily)|nr:sigma-70 family RNA polymerase sigma factor [Planctomycetota bacterium]
MASAQFGSDGLDVTSRQIQAAVDGDRAATARLVERFTPLLLAQARYRLQGGGVGTEPEDVVQEVWATALPKLHELRSEDGRWTPLVARFLATMVLHTVNGLLRRNLRRRGGNVGRGGEQLTATDPLQRAPTEITGIVTQLARQQRADRLHAALARLGPGEREVVVLRGIEQLTNVEVARLLGIDAAAVTRRWQRALQHLRQELPDSVFTELE